MTIRLLNDNVINKIAAGEVIERPASVVKELVENSIDAGSTIINVRVNNGGLDLIEVEDNGKGMSYNEIPLAFTRHATSKITDESDLFKIYTMGFRGEALPSIASVSRMEIQTKQTDSSGVKAEFEAGVLQNIINFPSPDGTRIVVRDLFFNTPARRKFLKSSVAENTSIHDIIIKLALSRTDISFAFTSNKKSYFKTPGNGILKDTLSSIYGSQFLEGFIPVELDGEKYSIYGLISKTDNVRSNRKNQLFYVNNRVIKSPMIYKSIDQAYKGLLVSREYPLVYLFLKLSPEDIDVNVHPQKTEVRFHDEPRIFSFISHVLRDTLYNYQSNSLRGSSNPKYSTIISQSSNYVVEPNSVYEKQQLPYTYNKNILVNSPERNLLSKPIEEINISTLALNTTDYRIIGQCFSSFIIVESGNKLFFVDQHAAHERILYSEKIKKNNKIYTQSLTFPITLDFSVEIKQYILNNQEVFMNFGIEIDDFGDNACIIRSAPSFVIGEELKTIHEIIDILKEDRNEDITDKILILMACKEAIKANQLLSAQEMHTIIDKLFNCNDYFNCPHGRPTIYTIDNMELSKKFKR